MQYLPLLWPVRQSGAAVEHIDVILTLGLLSKQHVSHTPISHVSLISQHMELKVFSVLLKLTQAEKQLVFFATTSGSSRETMKKFDQNST